MKLTLEDWCKLLAIAVVAILVIGIIWWGMATDGRNLAQARNEGKAAASSGVPPEACPYGEGFGGSPRERQAWMRGWAEGKQGRP